MLRLDHLTVIAPTLAEGVDHVKSCLDLDIPFGTRHDYLGTHNHRVQLGDTVYLEIIASDPVARRPDRPRWFGLDNPKQVRADWETGKRLRGWVASTTSIDSVLAQYDGIFGERVDLPFENPTFCFAIPADGSLPLAGAVPSLIDHRNDPTSMAEIPDLGARLQSLTLAHPDPDAIRTLYNGLSIDRAPTVIKGPDLYYRALITTPAGQKELR
ncbi:VOC family protein [Thalassospira sp.]|uniref:VOC family protein n=1 Tax=Thalassospira sp. TaxID=1912094 RepID=UPI00311D93E7